MACSEGAAEEFVAPAPSRSAHCSGHFPCCHPDPQLHPFTLPAASLGTRGSVPALSLSLGPHPSHGHSPFPFSSLVFCVIDMQRSHWAGNDACEGHGSTPGMLSEELGVAPLSSWAGAAPVAPGTALGLHWDSSHRTSVPLAHAHLGGWLGAEPR